jgi:4,5-DOPA dioxygenase extradiol
MTTPVGAGADRAVMPAAFFGHGRPMNALELNRYTKAWRTFF